MERAKEMARHLLAQFGKLEAEQFDQVVNYITENFPEQVSQAEDLTGIHQGYGEVRTLVTVNALMFMDEDQLNNLNRWADRNLEWFKAY